jgi:archaellum component FlaG (FlaF/FlaG flagellin family)
MIKTFVIALMLSMALAACFNSPSKWRHDMPDDGTMLCSVASQGFRITNNPWGFRVDRYQAFDSECAKRMK